MRWQLEIVKTERRKKERGGREAVRARRVVAVIRVIAYAKHCSTYIQLLRQVQGIQGSVCLYLCLCVSVECGEHLTKGCAIKLRLIMPTMNVNQLESNISVYIKISALLIYAAHTRTTESQIQIHQQLREQCVSWAGIRWTTKKWKMRNASGRLQMIVRSCRAFFAFSYSIKLAT